MNEAKERSVLGGRNVVLYKTLKEGEVDPYVEEFTKHNYKVRCVPVLEFSFINISSYTELLRHSENFSAIVFTSPRAVEATLEALRLNKGDDQTLCEKRPACLDLQCYVVGTSTYMAAQKLGFIPAESDCGSASNLVDFIMKDLPMSDKPLLYPCCDLRLDILPQRLTESGYHIKEIVVYERKQSSYLESRLENTIKTHGLPDVVVYFSPSGVEYTYPYISTHLASLKHSKVVAIGPSTEKALQKKQIPVTAVSRKPDAVTLLATVNSLLPNGTF